MTHHPQVRQRKQRLDLQRVFLQAPVAHLAITKLALEHSERVLDLGMNAGLYFLQQVSQGINRIILLVQIFALTRAHRYMPSNILFGIESFLHPLITSVTKDVGFFAVDQAVARDVPCVRYAPILSQHLRRCVPLFQNTIACLSG